MTNDEWTVGKLRARMKMITDDCLVIWYDSVTIQELN